MRLEKIEDLVVPSWGDPPISRRDLDALVASIRAEGFWAANPIVVWRTGEGLLVVCGASRLAAARAVGLREVPVVEEPFAGLEAARARALADNVARRNMTPEQIFEAKNRLGEVEAARAEARARQAGHAGAAGKVSEILAPEVGVSPRQVEVMGMVRREAPDLWRKVCDPDDPTTLSSAARKVLARRKKKRYLEVLATGQEVDLAVEGILQDTTAWLFHEPDPRFGGPTPARLPGQAVANVLWCWSKPGAVVVDPFAGSGTTLDVCRWMGRRCLASDLTPGREDVERADAAEALLEVLDSGLGPDLVLLDLPVWGQFRTRPQWSDDPKDLANVGDSGTWAEKAGRILGLAVEALRPGGVLVVVVPPTQPECSVVSWTPWVDQALEATEKVALAARVVLVSPRQEWGGPEVARARELRRLVKAYREILVARKEKPE